MSETHSSETVFRLTLAGITVEGRAHPLSAWFVLALRLVIGFAFFYSGAEKLLGGFDSQGYLVNVAGQNGNPLEGMFLWMGQTPWFVEFVNIAIPGVRSPSVSESWSDFSLGLRRSLAHG